MSEFRKDFDKLEENITEKKFLNDLDYMMSSDGEYDPQN